MLFQPKKRLGANGIKEIKNHPFFKDVDWTAFSKREVPSPLEKYICAQRPELFASNKLKIGEYNSLDELAEDPHWEPQEYSMKMNSMYGAPEESGSMQLTEVVQQQ